VLEYKLGMGWVTKYHPDLGVDLQEALEVLEGEGWEVAVPFQVNLYHQGAFTPNHVLILKRRRPGLL